MDVSSLLIFAGALLVAAGSPGPSIAALVARVLSGGLRDVLPFLLAMWIGEAVWLTLAVFGENLLNSRYRVSTIDFGALGFGTAIYVRPRVIGVEGRVDF